MLDNMETNGRRQVSFSMPKERCAQCGVAEALTSMAGGEFDLACLHTFYSSFDAGPHTVTFSKPAKSYMSIKFGVT